MKIIKQGKTARVGQVRSHRKVGRTLSVSCKACRGPLAVTNSEEYALEVFTKHESGDHTSENGTSLLKVPLVTSARLTDE